MDKIDKEMDDKRPQSPRDQSEALDYLNQTMKEIENPAIIKNYENVINWLLGINTLVIVFIFGNYDRLPTARNWEAIDSTNISSNISTTTIADSLPVIMDSIPHYIIMASMFFFMISTVTLFIIRLRIFFMMNTALIPSVKITDIKGAEVKLGEKTEYVEDLMYLTWYMLVPILTSFAGLLALFTYILISISSLIVLAIYVTTLNILAATILIPALKRYRKAKSKKCG